VNLPRHKVVLTKNHGGLRKKEFLVRFDDDTLIQDLRELKRKYGFTMNIMLQEGVRRIVKHIKETGRLYE